MRSHDNNTYCQTIIVVLARYFKQEASYWVVHSHPLSTWSQNYVTIACLDNETNFLYLIGYCLIMADKIFPIKKTNYEGQTFETIVSNK